MTEGLKIVLSLSLSGSLVIGALLLLRPLVRGRISRRWQYYIWLIAVLRLLLPFGPESSPAEELTRQVERTAVYAVGLPEVPVPANTNPEYDEPVQEPEEPSRLREIGAAALERLWVVWLAGALALLIRKATAYQSFLRYMRAGWTAAEDPAVLDLAAEAGAAVGVRRPVEVYVNPMAASPMLLGTFRPKVVLPSAELPEEDLRWVLRHELTHCRRWDGAYKWLVQLTVCVHWFNPLVHWMSREVERACELSCDEAVLRKLDETARRGYGDTLLRTMEIGGGYKAAAPSATLGESGTLLKERLDAIMNFRKLGKSAAALSLALAVMLGLTAAAAGAYPGMPAREGGTAVLYGNREDEAAKARRYTMESYYEASYMFGIGWNLERTDVDSATVTLTDGSKLKVYFNEAAKSIMKDKEAMAALTKVLARLWEETRNADFPMTRPLVYQWENTGDASLNDLAEKYYEEGSLPQFRTVFAGLSEPEQTAWMEKIYQDKELAFFSVAADGLDVDGDVFKAFAERAYADKSISCFSVLADRMSGEMLESWLARAEKDRRTSFQASLLDHLGREKEKDRLEAYLDAQQTAMYEAWGITKTEGMYYYQGERVNIFLDCQEDNGFYTMSMDSKGSLNIKIVRNGDGVITGVKELTQAEISDLFGTEEDKDDDWDWDWDDETWNESEKERTAAYKAHGITRDGKNYYYEGKLVNIFLDLRPNKSFYTLDMNSAGTVNIKIIRNEDGEITGAAYLTEKEITELFEGGDEHVVKVNAGGVGNGEYVWLGTFELEEGDVVYYDITAEKGERLSVGFANPGVKKPQATYMTITNRRTDGELEVKSGPMIWEDPLEPGEYSLFVHTKGGTLENVTGYVTIVKN